VHNATPGPAGAGSRPPDPPDPPRKLKGRWWPEAGAPSGAVLYAVLGGLIAWLLVYVLSHVHVYISWH
jgi:hypothetical protein